MVVFEADWQWCICGFVRSLSRSETWARVLRRGGRNAPTSTQKPLTARNEPRNHRSSPVTCSSSLTRSCGTTWPKVHRMVSAMCVHSICYILFSRNFTQHWLRFAVHEHCSHLRWWVLNVDWNTTHSTVSSCSVTKEYDVWSLYTISDIHNSVVMLVQYPGAHLSGNTYRDSYK